MPMPTRLPPYIERVAVFVNDAGTEATIIAETVEVIGDQAVNQQDSMVYALSTQSATDLTAWLSHMFD